MRPLTGRAVVRRGPGSRLVATAAVLAAVLAGAGACATGREATEVPAAAPPTSQRPSEPGVASAAPTPTPSGEQYCFGSTDPTTCVPIEDMPPGWSAELAGRMVTYQARLHEALTSNENLLTVSYDPPTIEVAWADPLPATLDPLIAEAAAEGIAVVWVEIAMSQEEAEALMLRLAEALTAADVAWTSVGPEHDYSGLRVGTAEPLDGAGRARILAIADAVAPGVPVSFEVVAPPVAL